MYLKATECSTLNVESNDVFDVITYVKSASIMAWVHKLKLLT
jgi:hypothetical protein